MEPCTISIGKQVLVSTDRWKSNGDRFFIIRFNIKWCENTLKRLCVSIKEKRFGQLTPGVIFLYDKTQLHVVRLVQNLLGCMK